MQYLFLNKNFENYFSKKGVNKHFYTYPETLVTLTEKRKSNILRFISQPFFFLLNHEIAKTYKKKCVRQVRRPHKLLSYYTYRTYTNIELNA